MILPRNNCFSLNLFQSQEEEEQQQHPVSVSVFHILPLSRSLFFSCLIIIDLSLSYRLTYILKKKNKTIMQSYNPKDKATKHEYESPARLSIEEEEEEEKKVISVIQQHL